MLCWLAKASQLERTRENMNHISKALRGVADKYNGVSLIIRIIVGLIAGTALALVVPHMTWIGEFGTLFVSALKAVAPILVFVLVASALAQGNSKLDGRFGTVLFLYLFTTFLSAVVAVLTSRTFPQTISLGDAADADVVPQGLSEVVQTLLTNIVANPIQAMIDGNYICILMWACLFGLAMKGIANESSKAFLANVADGVSPSAGKDVNGPTAAANSVSRLDHYIASNGTLFNQKFHPSALSGRNGLENFVGLIRSYFDQKGSHMQFNVVSRETLLDAQKHPEQYKHLVVRVAGYSALFTTLSKSLQDDIIRRTEQGF